MVSLAGPRSVKAKFWLDDLQGFLSVSDFRFQRVHQYKLLGGVVDATSSPGPQVSGRQFAVTELSAPYHRYLKH